jgi:K+-sensing histidine kinase KdpD
LERAVYNILSNAIKFTPKGGTIEAKLALKGSMLCLSVQDSGSGIPQELRDHVYTRFQRGPALEDGRFGIGLGMVLIRSTASAHGGTVLIDHPGQTGTRITMTMDVRRGTGNTLRSGLLRMDYAGEQDHSLIELSDILPPEAYN